MKYLDELAARRRFGMKPGLDTIREICRRLGDPQKRFRPIHVAGTNGKGAVCAILDACLGGGRYTSPHLVRLNERFFLKGAPLDDVTLERAAGRVAAVATDDTTFFEALTAVAFLVYAEAQPCPVVLETGLGGRLDATNVCAPCLSVITRIGLEHCDWLGDTIEQIAGEKAGIVKPGVPVVLGRNEPSVRAVVEARAAELGSPFFYAPELAAEDEIPADFSLLGSFNRENAVTALAALKVIGDVVVGSPLPPSATAGFSRVVWPGRFQRIGNFIVDGAHNPPAATALAHSLADLGLPQNISDSQFPICNSHSLTLIAGFCGDKDVMRVLEILAPFVCRGLAIQTNNPRSLSAEDTVKMMRSSGIDAISCGSLREAIAKAVQCGSQTLICGSLFLAGEALVELGAYPWRPSSAARGLFADERRLSYGNGMGLQRSDPSELLEPSSEC